MFKELPPFAVTAAEAGHTVAKILRSRLHEFRLSWTQIRTIISSRRVLVDGAICLDDARRLKEHELVQVRAEATVQPKNSREDNLVIRYLDQDIVVVEKPAGLNTVRHPSELHWSEKRRKQIPTLQDVTQWAISRKFRTSARLLPALRIVHRIDRETSGLLIFARSVEAERSLGAQFKAHSVLRQYKTLVPGRVTPQTITSYLCRDRGDGRRGSTDNPRLGKRAITHIRAAEPLQGYSLLTCQLETGRTHQIRIHLAELGHPVCGDKVYSLLAQGERFPDLSGAQRLALHAETLGIQHPTRDERLHWQMPLPEDMTTLLAQLKQPKTFHSSGEDR